MIHPGQGEHWEGRNIVASFVPWQGQSSHTVRYVAYSRASCDSQLAGRFAGGFILSAIYLSLLVQLGKKGLNTSKC